MDYLTTLHMFCFLMCVLPMNFAWDVRECKGSQNTCPSYAYCIANGTSVICSCRLYRQNPNGTWPEGCTDQFQPRGLSRYEKAGQDASDWVTARLPDAMLTATASDSSNEPKYARLHDNGWCAQPSPATDYLQVDLGTVTKITMLASQGRGRTPSIALMTKTFELSYGLSNNSLQVYTDASGDPMIFTRNADNNDDIIFHVLPKPISARYIRVTTLTYEISKCLRLEVFGSFVINECTNGWSQCDVKASCQDTVSSYKCKCPVGYDDESFYKTAFLCRQIDECFEDRHNCSKYALCVDTDGAFTCQCRPGFRGDGYYCEDINECKEDKHNCDNNAHCNNTIGSYDCNCKSGFSGNGVECKDVDECTTKTHKCHSKAYCSNTHGGYQCSCVKGYTGTGFTCTDFDECRAGAHTCHEFAECYNNVGSYKCGCKWGYKGTGYYCNDLDECSLGLSTCKDNEKCFNTIGSFLCQCPVHIPWQPEYNSTELVLVTEISKELSKIDIKDFESPVDHHAHILKTIYKLLERLYRYHYQETRQSYFLKRVLGDTLAIEMYDFRCSDVSNMTFPNYCHTEYGESIWQRVTDRVDLFFTANSVVPFEQWATPPPTTGPPTTPTTSDVSTESTTPTTTTMAPTTTQPTTPKPVDWTGRSCSHFYNTTTGWFASPGFPFIYPTNAQCFYLVQAPEYHSVYVKFNSFHLEFDRKCIFDNVRFYDGTTTEDFEIARYCGKGIPVPVRSNSRYLLTVFTSDVGDIFPGFNATWNILQPRVSVTCLAYNIESFTADRDLATKYIIKLFEMDRKIYIPVARMLACAQKPLCNVSIPRPFDFTFEHTVNNRAEKICVHWDIDSVGTSYSTEGCQLKVTNKTHTICQCWVYGVVTVLGRDPPYYTPPKPHVAYALGQNCYLSLVFVILTLIGTLMFLLFKDSWLQFLITVLTDRNYDSGRIIQLHVCVSVLLAEMVFAIVTFNVNATGGTCFFMAFVFYYLLLTVFFWLFIYTLFLYSNITPVFDASKYNIYKIYLLMGYGVPILVTLTVSGLNFKLLNNEKMCWIMFTGSTVWGFSGAVVTLALGSLTLLLFTIKEAHGAESGILLQEKCLKNMFTTFFCLLTAIFGARAVQSGDYGETYMFSLCNLLQAYSIVVIYCIFTRESPIVRINQVIPARQKPVPGLHDVIAEVRKQQSKGNDPLEKKSAEVEDGEEAGLMKEGKDQYMKTTQADILVVQSPTNWQDEPISRVDSGIACHSDNGSASEEEDNQIFFNHAELQRLEEDARRREEMERQVIKAEEKEEEQHKKYKK